MMALEIGSKPRVLQYDVGGLREDYVLLEVDEALLRTIEAEGVDMKGDALDEAVLCTSDSTYALKCVDTTNLLLLVPPKQDGDSMDILPSPTPEAPDTRNPADIGLQTQLQKGAAAARLPPIVAHATAKAHLEVTRVPPRLERLKQLLGRPYGLDDEQQQQRGGTSAAGGDVDMTDAAAAASGFLTTEQMLERVQASRAELLAGLSSLRGVQLGGVWRLVDPGYLGSLLELVLVCCTEQGWSWDAIPEEQCAQVLTEDGYDPAMVVHCLRVYSSPADTPGGAEGTGGASPSPGPSAAAAAAAAAAPPGTSPGCLPHAQPSSSSSSSYRLDEKKVCLHFARKLLRRQPQWGEEELFEAWRREVAPPFQPDMAMLRGEVAPLGDDTGSSSSSGAGGARRLVWFPAESLPVEPGARFAALFGLRPRWTREELDPFLEGWEVPGQTVGALLLKYCRASQPQPTDPMVFSAR